MATKPLTNGVEVRPLILQGVWAVKAMCALQPQVRALQTQICILQPPDAGISQKVTLPPLQKVSVNIFFVFAWQFCIEKWRGFWVNFSDLRFSRNEARKLLKNFGGKFGAKFGAKSGTKIRKIRKSFVLRLL